MSDNNQQALERLLDVQLPLMESGVEIDFSSIDKLIGMIKKESAYSLPSAKMYLKKVASRESHTYPILLGIFDATKRLIDEGHCEDAFDIFTDILGHPGESPEWDRRGYVSKSSSLVFDEFVEIISTPGLLSQNPANWGRLIVDLQSALTRHAQKDFCESPLYEATHELEQPRPEYSEDFDDLVLSNFYDIDDEVEDRGSRVALRLTARIIQRALVELLQAKDFVSYDLLRTSLNESRWSLGYAEQAVVLFDAIENGDNSESVLREAVDLLLSDAGSTYGSLYGWRRLLRASILPRVDEKTRKRLLASVERCRIDDTRYAADLSDFSEFDILDETQAEAVQSRMNAGEIYPPYDMRQFYKDRAKVEVSYREDDESYADKWPIPQHRDAIEMLWNWWIGPSEDYSTEVSTCLKKYSDGIATVVSSFEQLSKVQIAECVAWSTKYLNSIKQCSDLCDPESEGNYLTEVYEVHLREQAPWWTEVASVSLRSLAEGPSSEYDDRPVNQVGWSSGDLFAQSLRFCDELLAVKEPLLLEPMIRQFERVIGENWQTWPTAARALALHTFRRFHWALNPVFQGWAAYSVSTDTDGAVVNLALDRLIRKSGSIKAYLEAALARLNQLTEPKEVAETIGRIVGAHQAAAAAEESPSERVREIAQFGQQLIEDIEQFESVRHDLIHGIVWSMIDWIGRQEKLGESVASRVKDTMEWGIKQSVQEDDTVESRHMIDPVDLTCEHEWTPAAVEIVADWARHAVIRLFEAGTVGDYMTLHFSIKRRIDDRDSIFRSHFSNGWLVEACVASAKRVVDWRKNEVTTTDLGYVHALCGNVTADLVRSVLTCVQDDPRSRDGLLQAVDLLADADQLPLAASLRGYFRRS